jgi:predicted lipoprotein with Yx(FWY)xxD motif
VAARSLRANPDYFRKTIIMKKAFVVGWIACWGAVSALAAGVPAHVQGDVLTGSNGMTLYTLDRDVADSGKSQWAYKGKPLYFWVKDQKPGDKTGDGVNGVWHAAKP